MALSATFAIWIVPQDPITEEPDSTQRPIFKRISNVTNDKPFSQITKALTPTLLMKEKVNKNNNKFIFYGYFNVEFPNGVAGVTVNNDKEFVDHWDMIPEEGADSLPFLIGCKVINFYWINKCRRQEREFIVPIQGRLPAQRARVEDEAKHDIAAVTAEEQKQSQNVENNSKTKELRDIIYGPGSIGEKVAKLRCVLSQRDLHKAAMARYVANVAYGDEHSVDMLDFYCVFCNKSLALSHMWSAYVAQRHYKTCKDGDGEILFKRLNELQNGQLAISELTPLPEGFRSGIIVDVDTEDNNIGSHIDWTSLILPSDSGVISIKNAQEWSFEIFDKQTFATRAWWIKKHVSVKIGCKAYYKRMYDNVEDNNAPN